MNILRRGYDVVDHTGTPDPADPDYLDYLNRSDPFVENDPDLDETITVGAVKITPLRTDPDLWSAAVRGLALPVPASLLAPPDMIIDADEATIDVFYEPEPYLGDPIGSVNASPRKVRETIVTVGDYKFQVKTFTVTAHLS